MSGDGPPAPWLACLSLSWYLPGTTVPDLPLGLGPEVWTGLAVALYGLATVRYVLASI